MSFIVVATTHLGAPKMTTTEGNVTKVRDFIRVLLDCFLNVLELAERVDIFKDRVG